MDDRYKTPEMAAIWDPRHRNTIERRIWLEVMAAQARQGVPIPPEAIEAYAAAAERVPDDELEQIAQIERETRHDVYARLLYFNRLAGHDYAHWGLTSADVIENAQQAQIVTATRVLADHAAQVLGRLADLIEGEQAHPTVARTHGRPAQITTVGKRVADWALELAAASATLEVAHDIYMPRGIKGAVGTRADMAALLHRHTGGPGIELADALDHDVTDGEAMAATGQCYPRGTDLPIVSAALQIAAACTTIATNVRLWAALGHANEERAEGQVGSSAMPHKSNPRYSERVCGLMAVARGYGSMLQSIAGGMWFEGDVSTSSTRRVALPGLFHTVDAMLANVAHVLDRLQFDRHAIAEDVRRHRAALATGRILDACVAAGMDRAPAHEVIRRHAELSQSAAIFTGRLADDPDVPLTYAQLEELVTLAVDVEPAATMASSCVGQLRTAGRAHPPAEWPGDLL